MTVGERIKAARKKRGLSQADLASAANVSQPTVANWENGSHAPRNAALTRLANILSTKPSTLIGGSDREDNLVKMAEHLTGTPIRNIPIYHWHQLSRIVAVGALPEFAKGFLSLSTKLTAPIAFLPPPEFAPDLPGTISIIAERTAGVVKHGKAYLLADRNEFSPYLWDEGSASMRPLGNRAAQPITFAAQTPAPALRIDQILQSF